MIIPILLFGNNSHILIGIQTKLLKKPYIIFIFILKKKKKKIEINWWVAGHPPLSRRPPPKPIWPPPTRELGVACATPSCSGGGATTPGPPLGWSASHYGV
jgi:hypothetical protein